MKDILDAIGIKKIIIFIITIIIIIIFIFGFAYVYNRFFYKRSYLEIEDIMKNAAISYMTDRPNNLPVELGNEVTIDTNILVSAEKMKDISYYLKDEATTCRGKVIVTKMNNGEFVSKNISDNTYLYSPYIQCGSNGYNTKSFVSKLKEDSQIVTEGNGLYNLNDELVYRGEVVDNYLKFYGNLYRIVKITSDNNIVLLYSDKKLDSVAWDDRYNSVFNNAVGINDFQVSRIKDSLFNKYKDSNFIKENRKIFVIPHNVYISGRGKEDNDKTGNLEKAKMLSNQYISLLPLYDYMNASLDSNCTSSISSACINYNYMSIANYNWWTGTPFRENTHQVFKISEMGANVYTTNSFAHMRPVIHITKHALYLSGNGTYKDPYILK